MDPTASTSRMCLVCNIRSLSKDAFSLCRKTDSTSYYEFSNVSAATCHSQLNTSTSVHDVSPENNSDSNIDKTFSPKFYTAEIKYLTSVTLIDQAFSDRGEKKIVPEQSHYCN